MVYPLWLFCIRTANAPDDLQNTEIKSVSTILLSYNGKHFLHEKIKFLLKELSCFENYELIIIDDNSTDGSFDVLQGFRNGDKVKVLYNAEQQGIPYSMNLGVAQAKYDIVVFCDQRQELSEGILKKIVEPLKQSRVGAVSACISFLDKEKKCSFLRMHENFLKSKESKSGNLMGVYGPCYAIKKQCYTDIPENIILDDLYLSLKILKNKQIALLDNCQIIDDNFSALYDYKRTRRYLSGLLQILKERSIVFDLNYTQRTMLVWHKYLRLLIPFMLFLCLLSAGITSSGMIEFFALLSALVVIILLYVLPVKFSFQSWLKNLIKMNLMYFTALIDILVNDYLLNTRKHLRQNQL